MKPGILRYAVVGNILKRSIATTADWHPECCDAVLAAPHSTDARFKAWAAAWHPASLTAGTWYVHANRMAADDEAAPSGGLHLQPAIPYELHTHPMLFCPVWSDQCVLAI